MPSPNHKARASSTSLSRANSTRSTSAAIKRGDLYISEPMPLPREGADGRLGPQLGAGPPDNQSKVSLRPTQDDGLVSQSGVSQPQKNGYHPPVDEPRRETYHAGSKSMHPHDSMSSVPSKGSVRRKKEGGFRATMRKIFGSKKRREPIPEFSQDHHRSDPITFDRGPGARGAMRSSSMPIHEVTRTSALGSHSPFAPFLEPNPEKPAEEQERASLPEELTTHRRRNTLPSIVLSAREAQTLAATLGKLGVRPTSKQESEGRASAVSSSYKRRSRSAGALRDTAREHRMSPIQWRPREDEIKYWRTSIIEDPVPTFHEARPETRETDVPQSHFSDMSDQPDQPTPQQERLGRQQSFDFGDLIGTTTDESISLEQRVTTLEVKLIDLEYAIARLQGIEVEKPVALGKPPRRRPDQQSADSSGSQSSHPNATFLSSPHDSLGPEKSHGDSEEAKAKERPTSLALTLRPQTALHQPVQEPAGPSRISNEQFDYLLGMIKSEQSAREKLEAQVAHLQRELDGLRSPPFAHTKSGTYPTPSPESQNPPNWQPRPQGGRVSAASSRRRDAGLREEYDTDTDDGFMDVYETPIEAHEHDFGIEGVQSSHVAGMI